MKEEAKEQNKEQPRLVGNKSEGYNYKYTSLGDLVIAGVDLPQMRVAVLTNGEQEPILYPNGKPIEYIEAFVNGEWIRGARIEVPSGNKMNEAQAYGSALTYARRYTALTVLGIACDDDNKLEVHSKEESEEQIKANMKKEISELWVKAGGAEKDFKPWFENKTKDGFGQKEYGAMKTMLLKKLNDDVEGKK